MPRVSISKTGANNAARQSYVLRIRLMPDELKHCTGRESPGHEVETRATVRRVAGTPRTFEIQFDNRAGAYKVRREGRATGGSLQFWARYAGVKEENEPPLYVVPEYHGQRLRFTLPEFFFTPLRGGAMAKAPSNEKEEFKAALALMNEALAKMRYGAYSVALLPEYEGEEYSESRRLVRVKAKIVRVEVEEIG